MLVEPFVLSTFGELLLQVIDRILLTLHLQTSIVQSTLYLALLCRLRRENECKKNNGVSFQNMSREFH